MWGIWVFGNPAFDILHGGGTNIQLKGKTHKTFDLELLFKFLGANIIPNEYIWWGSGQDMSNFDLKAY